MEGVQRPDDAHAGNESHSYLDVKFNATYKRRVNLRGISAPVTRAPTDCITIRGNYPLSLNPETHIQDT